MATPVPEPVELVDPTKQHYTLSPPVADVTGPRPLATIVLPCYNEARRVVRELERITEAMDGSAITYELLVIDDASTDGSRRVLQEALPRFPRMRLMPFRRNGGAGTARRIGTREARGEIVVWADAGLTYPNERIPELVRHLVEHPECGQVVGARNGQQGKGRGLRRPGTWLVRRVAEGIAGVPIADLDSAMRAFRRELSLPLLRLLPPRCASGATITLAFLANQHDVDYLAIECAKRPSWSSRRRPLRTGYGNVVQAARMVMYFNPLAALLPPALALFLLGIAAGVADILVRAFSFVALTVLLLLSGLVVGSLALLADLVVRSRPE